MKKRSSPVQIAAIDLGATSGRVILGTYAKGNLSLEEVHRFPNKFEFLGKNCYWNLAGLFAEMKTGLLKAKEKAPKLASCGVDVWGVDSVLVDKKGRLVQPTYAYRDTRSEALSRKLAKSGIEDVYKWTGIQVLPFNTSLQLQETLTTYPAIKDIADRCLFLPDYFNFLLSGKMETEISVASTGQLLDVKSCKMSKKALDYFGIPTSWFSKPKLSPANLGKIKGIPELKDVQVTMVPGHDTSCAYDAMPASEDGTDFYISSGTWSLMGFESDKPVLGKEALKACISNERMGDGRYRPLTNCQGLWLLEQTLPSFTSQPMTNADWKRLIAAAKEAPAPKALINVTDRSLFNPASMKDAIDKQLKRRKHKAPKDLAGYTRLICESLGKGHADGIERFEKMTGKTFERILIVGGGSKNPLLCQATADYAKRPVVSFSLEGTAVGNMANQLIALGAVESIPAFRRQLLKSLKKKVYQPKG